MTAPGDPESTDDARARRFRRLLRAGAAAVGLYLVGDGLLGIWPEAGTTTRVVIVVAVLLGLAVAGAGAAYLARRDREG